MSDILRDVEAARRAIEAEPTVHRTYSIPHSPRCQAILSGDLYRCNCSAGEFARQLWESAYR